MTCLRVIVWVRVPLQVESITDRRLPGHEPGIPDALRWRYFYGQPLAKRREAIHREGALAGLFART